VTLSEADLAIRATGIGASEAWKLVLKGGPRMEVFGRLVEGHRDEGGLFARRGHHMEDFIADEYSRRFELSAKGMRLDRSGTLRHHEHACVLATPDRILVDVEGRPLRLVQIKAPTFHTRDDWGPDGSDVFPLRYRIQCTLEMAVTGLRQEHLVALIDGEDEIRVYDVPWDQDLADLVVGELVAFWRDHIMPREAPYPDGTDATAEYLARRYPKNRGVMRSPSPEPVRVGDDEVLEGGDEELARALRGVKAQIKALKVREQELANIAKARTADADGVDGCWTWRLPAKSQGRTAWKKVVADAKVPADVIAKHTKPAGRRFLLVGEQEEEDTTS
jgi:predicted phage-related endonuclease